MIERHKTMHLFRTVLRDCCNSLVTSLSEQKSPILQGGRQLLGSACEPLIAEGGKSHACLLQVLMCVITLGRGRMSH